MEERFDTNSDLFDAEPDDAETIYNEMPDDDEPNNDVPRVFIRINGMTKSVESGTSFDKIKELGVDAGFSKFRVFMNGTEIKPDEVSVKCPDLLEGNSFEVKPFDEAG